MRKGLAVALGLVISLSGCATLLGGGTRQAISIDATPSEARYAIQSSSGIQMSAGDVPASVSLPRKNEYQVDISLDGYETRTVAITRGTNGWIWGNLVLGWIVGFIVDFATGSAYELEPATLNITLERGDDVYAIVRFLDDERELIHEERVRMDPIR